MALGQYVGAGSSRTALLYHLNGWATDSSGNANNWTATNITWNNGYVGSGKASLNWTSSRIQSGTVAASNVNTDFTINMVVRPNSFSGFNRFFHYGDNHASNRRTIDILHYSGTGIPYVSIQSGGTSDDTYDAALPGLSTTNPSMLTAIKNSTTSKLSFYVNGSLSKEVTSTKNLWVVDHTLVDLGCYYDSDLPGYGSFLNGDIDEFSLDNFPWPGGSSDVKKMNTYRLGRFATL